MLQSAQAWFQGGPSGSDGELQNTSPSLLADWNSYAASRSSEDDGASAFGFDIESAVRTANDKVTGTFNVVSKGVRELPGNFQNATSNVPSGKSLVYFAVFLASGVFFVFIAFTMFLPVMVLMPQKFALCFTFGCALIITSFFALRGPKTSFLTCVPRRGCPSQRYSSVAWWVQSMFPWCFIATFSLSSSL